MSRARGPDEPRCSATLAGRQCQLYDQHDGMHRHVDKRIDLDATWDSPPWRFDVPEVPTRVPAFRDAHGSIWVRTAGGWWRLLDEPEGSMGKPLEWVLQYAPLEECPDPRATT